MAVRKTLMIRVKLSLNLLGIKKQNNLSKHNDTIAKKKVNRLDRNIHASRKIDLIYLNKKLGETGQQKNTTNPSISGSAASHVCSNIITNTSKVVYLSPICSRAVFSLQFLNDIQFVSQSNHKPPLNTASVAYFCLFCQVLLRRFFTPISECVESYRIILTWETQSSQNYYFSHRK